MPGLVQSLEARRQARWKEANRLQRERQLYGSRHEWGVLPPDQCAWYKRQRRRRRLRRKRRSEAASGSGGSDSDDEDGEDAVLVQAVSCSALHCAAIDTRGAVFTWGCDQAGCLGRDITAGFEFKAPPFAGAAFTSTFRAAATQELQGKQEALLRRQALDRTTRRTYTAMVGSLGASPFADAHRKVKRGAAVDGVAAAMEAASGLGGLLYSRGDGGRVSRCDGGGQVGGRADAVSRYYSGALGGGADLSSKHGRYLARMDAMSAAATSARTRGSNAPGAMIADRRHAPYVVLPLVEGGGVGGDAAPCLPLLCSCTACLPLWCAHVASHVACAWSVAGGQGTASSPPPPAAAKGVSSAPNRRCGVRVTGWGWWCRLWTTASCRALWGSPFAHGTTRWAASTWLRSRGATRLA